MISSNKLGWYWPTKMKSYFKSLHIKNKTDQVDAKLIAAYGLEREPVLWEPMAAEYKLLRDYCRELLALKKDMQRAKRPLHVMQTSYRKYLPVMALKKSQIAFYESSLAMIAKAVGGPGHQPKRKDSRAGPSWSPFQASVLRQP